MLSGWGLLTLGGGVPHIIVRHVIPLIAAPLIVEATFGIAAAVICHRYAAGTSCSPYIDPPINQTVLRR